MKVKSIRLWLTVMIGAGQSLQLLNPTNSTATLASINKRGVPPAIPTRPAPTPPPTKSLRLSENPNDAAWEKAKCKGANFLRAMRGSDREAGQAFTPARDSAASEYEALDFDAAEKWGWTYSERPPAGDFRDWGMERVLADLGVSDMCHGWGGSIDCITFVHGLTQSEDGSWEYDAEPYVVDGKTYRRSGAHYSVAFDAPNGGQWSLNTEWSARSTV